MAATLEDRLDQAVQQVGTTILGKERAIRLAVSCLLARGHLLIEDLPGMGKTTLAHALARCLGLQYQRIQFTSDLLPADILGAAVYERQRETFVFHPGPIFAQLILADEINRATPKTQSALLEAMEEGQVTIEGETRKLPEPFFVIATQNPAYQIGTFPLPESQLDRFLMRIELGYPDAQAERLLLEGEDRRDVLARLPVCLTPDQLREAQGRVAGVHAAPPLLDYVQGLLAFSRQSSLFRGGLSPRAGLALLRAARAWALLHRRGHVLPEDVQAVLPAVVGHRLYPGEEHLEQTSADLVGRLRAAVTLPA
ncbi:MAG: AAA family ATPase [Candidatus Contendobacter sp.]|nr:AAA family ATPase [Candidatus Contendobacter sp.]MDS4060563.1 AAA family ATPase [Candidatus Contendobacter sp.]